MSGPSVVESEPTVQICCLESLLDPDGFDQRLISSTSGVLSLGLLPRPSLHGLCSMSHALYRTVMPLLTKVYGTETSNELIKVCYAKL